MRKQEPDTVTGDSVGHGEHGQQRPESELARIAAKARSHPKEKFNNLMHHLTAELVKECLRKIPGSSAAGADGITSKQALENADWMLPPRLTAIHRGIYDAPAVRRVYIPKPNREKRPIGVTEVVDRAIQAGAAKILSAIYEQEFLNCSFGFREGLSCHHALATINELLSKWRMSYAWEVDIRDFFGSLNHGWLNRFLEHRICDKRMLKLINAWLKAGVLEDGRWQQTERGTPQGGSISPLLANIYLHYVLDLWFEKVIKRKLRAKAHLVRYCDDFVILFQDKQDLENVKALLKVRLEQFGLTMAQDKTHTTDLTPRENHEGDGRRSMTFLGFTVFRARNRKGNGWKTVYQTEAKRFTRAKAAMKEKLKRMMHRDVAQQAKAINAILSGYYRYYGVAGNSRALMNFWYYTIRFWRRSLSRRSQNGLVNWEKMRKILEEHPLAAPKIYIPYPQIASYVRL